ncbi:MAG: N-acetylglucosamine-6-phosphate deacetylase [Alphaproteobacteria bacterium]|nr:N-acetylglucosamine-6-phosphate deacetylase [Alphaproteobacteria bacterium]
MKAFIGSRIFDGEAIRTGVAVLADGARVAAVVPEGDVPASAERVPLDGGLLTPGFVDLQVNGGGGVLFNTTPTVDAIRAIGRAHRAFGTTGFLVTFITDAPEKMAAAVEVTRAALAEGVPGLLGLHLEGPFVNPARRGIHDARFIRVPTQTDLALLAELPVGRTLVTLAPELAPPGLIERLVSAGVVVAAGHTDATYDQAMTGFRRGITGVTHLFNAMTPLASRAPGMVGAALDHQPAWCGLIVDGHHVHPAALRMAIAAKPKGAMILVSDAMPPAAGGPAAFDLGGRAIRAEGGRLVGADGTLAGADLDMARAVANAVRLIGLDLGEALRMASLYPARAIDLDDRGRIAPGQRADLVLLDDRLQAIGTWIGGDATHEGR